jgi:hypothetical protein
MDERRFTLEKDIYQIPEDNRKNCNYRLMRENEIPSWFIETVIYHICSRKTWISTRSMAEVIEFASRLTTVMR